MQRIRKIWANQPARPPSLRPSFSSNHLPPPWLPPPAHHCPGSCFSSCSPRYRSTPTQMRHSLSSAGSDVSSQSEGRSMSPAPSLSRSKRWPSVSDLDQDDMDDDELKPTRSSSKRAKTSQYAPAGSGAAARSGSGATQSTAGPRVDGGDKEARRIARMLRNRSTSSTFALCCLAPWWRSRSPPS